MKRIIWSIVAVVLVGGGLVAALLLAPTFSSPDDTTPQDTETVSDTANAETSEATQKGRYVDYSEAAVSAKGYDTTIIFFHAPWCPECRAFEEAINTTTLPDGVQILKADYDSSTELKQRYGITIQTTFVAVDDNGELIKKWVGYGENKSVDTILENV